MSETTQVLLVEDDPGDARLLVQRLSTADDLVADIEHVATLGAAVERINRDGAAADVDVVLLDLALPDGVGIGSLRRLLTAEVSVPVVVMTELADDELARDAVEAGAQDYVVKGSVTGEMLARVLRHAIERHRLQSALQERAKEMAGLYRISQTLHRDLSPPEVAADVAGHLVEAMQWPRRCRGRVAIDDAVATAGPPSGDDVPELVADIVVDGEVRGHVAVGYADTDRPFLLPEEQHLVDRAADAVAEWLHRRDIQRQLVRDEERLRVMVAQLPGIIWTTDTDLRVTSYAGKLADGLDAVDGDPTGESFPDLLGTSVAEEALPHFDAALGGDSVVFEQRWLDRWWRSYLEPKRTDDGQVVGTVCLALDITHEKQHQAELGATRERLTGLWTNAADAMILADDDGAYLQANPAACELTGRAHDELIGLHAWDLLADPDQGEAAAASTMQMWRQFIEDGTIAGELPIRRPNGTVIQVEFRAVANIADGVHLSVLRDVTARKRAEEALAASEARFRAMAESATDAIYRIRLEPDVAFDYLNSSVAEISGFTLDEWYDNPLLYLQRAHPDDVPLLDPARLTPGEPTTVTVRFRHAEGHWIYLEDSRHVIVEDGRPVGVQGVARDVTARQEAEQALRETLEAEQQAAERLRAIDELKTTFLQAISHELRTPLTSILGYAKTLLAQADALTDDQVRDFHRRLTSNATRLDTLLTDLLDVDRLHRGNVRLDLQPTDLTTLAEHVISAMDLAGRDCQLDDTSAVAVVDARKVERILHNLLANAVKHTPPDSTIWVGCATNADTTTITVSDNGPGIPAVVRDHVFEPFWQGSTVRDDASPGTGIGLSLVRRLASLHGGRITVGDRPGGGAAFTVTLPTTHPDAPRTAPTGPLIVSAAEVDHDGRDTFRETMQHTVDQLDAATDPDEATGILLTYIQGLGAQLRPADTNHPDLLEIDLSLGTTQPLRAAAPEGTAVRRRLENHLPFLVQHARHALATPKRSGTAGSEAPEPTDGVVSAAVLQQTLDQLDDSDAVLTLTLSSLNGQADSTPEPRDPINRLIDLIHGLSRPHDQLLRSGPTELTLILPATTQREADTIIQRLSNAWRNLPTTGHLIGTEAATARHAPAPPLDKPAD